MKKALSEEVYVHVLSWQESTDLENYCNAFYTQISKKQEIFAFSYYFKF